MIAHNLVIADFIKVLKEIKAKGHTHVDLEVNSDLTISLKGHANENEDTKDKKDKGLKDIDWEQII